MNVEVIGPFKHTHAMYPPSDSIDIESDDWLSIYTLWSTLDMSVDLREGQVVYGGYGDFAVRHRVSTVMFGRAWTTCGERAEGMSTRFPEPWPVLICSSCFPR